MAIKLRSKSTAAADCETCQASDARGKGYLYAFATAILCPCHMPLWGVLLGGTAAGTFFYQHFWALAILLGLLTLLSLFKAMRILL
jgi:hypothetical protein